MSNDPARPAAVTLDWVTDVPSSRVSYSVAATDIPDLEEIINARYDAELIREHALPDLVGCQREGLLSGATLEVSLDGVVRTLEGTLGVVDPGLAAFWTDEVVLDFNLSAADGTMRLEQATGPDWFWVTDAL